MSEANPNENALPATAGTDSTLPASVTTDSEGGATADYIMSLLDKEQAEDTSTPQDGDTPDEGTDAPETDDVAASDDAEDESEENSDEDNQAELFEVTVSGKTEKVTREELLKGYSRNRDYSQKTEALAREKAQVEAIKAQHEAALQNALQYLHNEDPIIAEGQKLDWAKLAQNDPAGFVQKQFQYTQRVQHLQAVQQQAAAAQQERLRQTGHVEAQKLLDAVPEWKDKAKAKADIDDISNYLKSRGFSDQELNGFTDSRAYMVARDALKYRKMMDAKATVKDQQVQVKAPAGRTVAPRASGATDKQENKARIKALDARAARTGSIDDQVDAILARI